LRALRHVHRIKDRKGAEYLPDPLLIQVELAFEIMICRGWEAARDPRFESRTVTFTVMAQPS